MRRRRRTKFVTKRALPFLLSKNAEAKRRNLSVTDHVLSDTTALNFDYTQFAQGVGVANRIGNEVKVTGFIAKLTFSVVPGDLPQRPRYARVLLWQPRGDVDVLPPDAAPTELLDPEQFTVWVDRIVPLPWTNSLDNSFLTIRKKFKPYMNMIFDSSSSTSIQKNKLQLSISTDESVNTFFVSVGSRMYFRDY